ncbi:hypothetical protein EAG_14432 [Camponotus floridanus]|uniref:Uncharacterized protein n=1 Tax=Camponotus floridanus TaxID=104421 RepID=E2A505_CAMFO|nr:hypothetical protein EAG_14432 [Camponotus floridanus]
MKKVGQRRAGKSENQVQGQTAAPCPEPRTPLEPTSNDITAIEPPGDSALGYWILFSGCLLFPFCRCPHHHYPSLALFPFDSLPHVDVGNLRSGSFVTEDDCENDRVLGNDPRFRNAEAARRLHGPQLNEGCEEAGERKKRNAVSTPPPFKGQLADELTLTGPS